MLSSVDRSRGTIDILQDDMAAAEYLQTVPVLTNTINCRTPESKPGPHDIIFLIINDTKTLVVADYENTCIKTFFRRNDKECHSRLGLPSKPYRIAKLEDNKLAVSLPYNKRIAIVTATPDLLPLREIETNKQYYGLTALTPTRLVAGSPRPPSVDILGMNGNVLQSLSPRIHGQTILQYPEFLSTTSQGNILVSDREAKSVLCLTPQGNVVFIYAPEGDRVMRNPAGIRGMRTGDILVADSWGSKVIQLNESGQFVREVLFRARDGVDRPWCFDCDENGNIYVRHSSSVIQVFTFDIRVN